MKNKEKPLLCLDIRMGLVDSLDPEVIKLEMQKLNKPEGVDDVDELMSNVNQVAFRADQCTDHEELANGLEAVRKHIVSNVNQYFQGVIEESCEPNENGEVSLKNKDSSIILVIRDYRR